MRASVLFAAALVAAASAAPLAAIAPPRQRPVAPLALVLPPDSLAEVRNFCPELCRFCDSPDASLCTPN